MFDIVWIGAAFICGLAARPLGLPPLVGYLAAGFVLHALGVQTGTTLAELSELGITLLLFSIGLKLNLRSLLQRHVWGTTAIHMSVTTTGLFGGLLLLATAGVGLTGRLTLVQALIVAFALSYSSTVFAVKVLEARGDMQSNYGSTAIGILIIQDLAAVGFLALSTGKLPSPWAVLLLLVFWPGRWLLWQLLTRTGHGELLILFGLSVAVGGAQLFDLFGVKGDLGALLIGVLLAKHPGAAELSKSLLGFKDLFLVGFFLTVGLTGTPGAEALALAVLLVGLLPFRTWLYFRLFARFGLRVRSSLLSSFGLSTYSEFGLIVASVAAAQGLLPQEWLGILAITLALSLAAASPINARAIQLFDRFEARLLPWQRDELVPEERPVDPGPATALVVGVGRVGIGAYDHLVEEGVGRVVGIESSRDRVAQHLERGRIVIFGSGTDPDLWARVVRSCRGLRLVVLAMPRLGENEYAARELRELGYTGRIASVVRFDDHARILREAGVDLVSHVYMEAGAGLAEDASRMLAEE